MTEGAPFVFWGAIYLLVLVSIAKPVFAWLGVGH